MNEAGMTKKSEGTGNQQCVHHWLIGKYNIGRCIKPGCGAVKDFGALLEEEAADQLSWLGTTLPRRPRKLEVIGEANECERPAKEDEHGNEISEVDS